MQMPSVNLTSVQTAGRGCRPALLPLALILLLVAGCSLFESDNSVEAPAAPTGVEATSQDAAIGLDWEAVGEADSYRVYRGSSSGVGVSGSPLDTGVSSAGYTDETAENGQTYYYVVTAVAEEGGETAESDPSSEVEKTPFSDLPDRP
jgi:fibronectin type 3 domain-containing protein